jgi:dUTP pyrophosphatase
MILKIRKLSQEAVLPTYAHSTDAGMDLFSIEDKIIQPHEYCAIRTGIAIEHPPSVNSGKKRLIFGDFCL